MKKLVIAAVIVAVGVGGVSYANYLATQEVRAEVDKQLAMVSEQTGATFSYRSISASVIFNSVTIENMLVTSADDEHIASIQTIDVSGYEANKISPFTSFDIKSFQLSETFLKTLPADTNKMLASASYDLHSSLNYDAQSGNSDVVVNIEAKKIASFNVELGLANSNALMDASLKINKMQQEATNDTLTYEQQLQQQTLLMQAMSQLEPRRIKFALKNQGELKDLLANELQKQGQSVEQMQAMLAQQLQQAPVTDEIAQALNNFAKELNTLTVSASIPTGKTMMQVNQQIMLLAGQPEALVEFINLKVKGE